MHGFSRFLSRLAQSFFEPTKLCLLLAILVVAGVSWGISHIYEVTSLGATASHWVVNFQPPPDFQGKAETLLKVYDYQYSVVINIGFAIILASSLNLVNGHTGQFSLGHAGFMAVGAYLGSVVSMGTILPTMDYPHFAEVHFSGSSVPVGTDPAVAYTMGGGIKAALWDGVEFIGILLTFVLNCLIGALNAATGAAASFPEWLRFPVALLIGGVMAALTGFLVGVPSLRLRGDYLAIVTLGFNEIIRVVVQNSEPLGAQTGINGIPRYTDFFWTFSFVALTIYVIYNLVNSTYGRGFLAVRDDEIAAEAMGINTTRYKVLAFVVAAFFAGIGGGLYAHFIQAINADGFTFMRSVDFVVMVIVGGMGSIWGVAAAATILTIIPELLRKLGHSEWLASLTNVFIRDLPPERQKFVHDRVESFFSNRMIFFSLILIIVMILRPQGIFGAGAIKKKEKLKAPPPKDKTPPTETAAAA